MLQLKADPSPAVSPGALVERARQKDPGAVREIIRRNNQRLFRVARAILRDDHEAEDVVQETYVRAFTHLDGFRGQSDLSTWLTRIALNEALSRRRRLRPTVDIDSLGEADEAEIVMFPTGSTFPGPEAALGRSEIREILQQAIDRLPEAFRIVFMLRDVEGRSVEEVAADLGVKAETIKTRLFRARRLLRERLADHLTAGLADVFPFDGARCNRLADKVLERLEKSWNAG